MEAMRNKEMSEGVDQVKMMTMMMVEQAKMQDELFKVNKVENEEFEENLLYFVSKDPEVAKAMQMYMMRMRASMGAGGMGGFM